MQYTICKLQPGLHHPGEGSEGGGPGRGRQPGPDSDGARGPWLDNIHSAVYLHIHAGPRLCPRHPRAGGQPRPRQLGQQPRGGGGQLQPLLGAGVRQVGVYISTYLHLKH